MGKAEVKWLAAFLGITSKKLKNPSSFDERLKIQKAVFLLKHLGVEPFTAYNFGLYLRGPYSPTLAKEYYALDDVRANAVALGDNAKLLKWFVSKDISWLEVASSIISVEEQYPNIEDQMAHSILRMSKPWVDEELFKRVSDELDSKGL